MKVYPITATKVDLVGFLRFAKAALGRNLNTQIDRNKLDIEATTSLLAMLGAMREPDESPTSILENCGPLANHVSFGFFVVCTRDALFEIMEDTQLHAHSVVSQDSRYMLAIVTGTLVDWGDALIAQQSVVSNYESRAFLNSCYLHFEKIGINRIWSDFKKKSLGDGTFLLEGN